MKELEQKYIDILEENGWSISSYTNDGRIELKKYSPAGEDFSIIVEVENFTESIREYANYFDADEHAEMWIEARGRVKGVPNSIRELIDDAEAIQKMLNELAGALEEKSGKENTVWTFFVLDFDNTYDNEELDSNGVQPIVYLIPSNKEKDVKRYAIMAHDDFHLDENKKLGLTITDYFEELMENNDCDYKRVGTIDLTVKERKTNYLVDYIPMEIV